MQAQRHNIPGLDYGTLEATVVPVLRAHQVEPVEIGFRTEGGGWVLRITVEPPGATSSVPSAESVTLGELADISRDLSAALDVADVIPHRYSLEVSSPGLDRPLRHARDFQRFVGQLAKVHLSRPAPDGQRVLRGQLMAANDVVVTMDVDGKEIFANLDDIEWAHLVFEMRTNPKGGRPKSSKKGITET